MKHLEYSLRSYYYTELTKKAQRFAENSVQLCENPLCISVKKQNERSEIIQSTPRRTAVILREKSPCNKIMSKANANNNINNPPCNNTQKPKQTYSLQMVLLYILCFITFSSSYAQSWSLKQCIDTALQNNLSLQSQQIQSQISAVQLKNSKQNFLPTVNAGAVHGYNWGQTIDLFTNQFASQQVLFDNFYLSSSVVLFSGLSRYYTVKKNNVSVSENKLNHLIEKRNVKINVAAAFLQVLINKAIVALSQNNLSKTKEELDRIISLFEAQQATKVATSEVKAQLAQDQYQVLKAENDLHYAKLLLQQILNIQQSKNFHLADSLMITPILSNFQDIPFSSLPEMKKAKLAIEKQKYAIQSLKGSYYPSLILSGSLGTGYSENDKVMTPSGEFETRPFSNQVSNNLYQSVSLTLSIPIFNRNANKNQIQIQKLHLKSLAIEKKKMKQELRKKIEQLITDIQNTTAQITALKKVNTSALLNYQNFKLKFEQGNTTYSQLIEAKNKRFQAKSNLIQTRYQLQFKRIVLHFYNL